MILTPVKTQKVQKIITNIYSKPLGSQLLSSISKDICNIMDSHYFAVLLFPNSYSSMPHFVSNNPLEFTDTYLSLLDKDFLLSTMIETNTPSRFAHLQQREFNGKKEFLAECQKIRPVSDCYYVPIKVDGYLAGYIAVARAGLKSHHFNSNDIEVFQFVSGFIHDAFIRSLELPLPAQNEALINDRGEIIKAGSEIKACLKELFGDRYWNTPKNGETEYCREFARFLNSFSSGLIIPGSGNLRLQHKDKMVNLTLHRLEEPEYRSCFPDQPQYRLTGRFSSSSGLSRPFLNLDQFNDVYGFTKREKEIIHYIYKGSSNREIAARLNISEGTVKRHIWNIFNKTGSENRTGLIFQLSG